MTTPQPYTITPADIMDIRLWRAKHGVQPNAFHPAPMDVPYLIVSPSDGLLVVHSRGFAVLATLRPELACAVLLAERIEPGWTLAVADAALTIEQAIRSPQERQEARRRAQASDAQRRALDAAHAEAARRRRTHFGQPPEDTNLDLSDLL